MWLEIEHGSCGLLDRSDAAIERHESKEEKVEILSPYMIKSFDNDGEGFGSGGSNL